MYFDINRPIDYDIQKMQAIIMHENAVEIIFAVDSNARSTARHDVLTNKRGKEMEELLISRQLYIAKEESCRTMFWTSCDTSNIDLTLLNNQANGLISGWAIHDLESCSDYNIIKIQSRQCKHHNSTDGKQQGKGEIQSGTEGYCEVSKEPHTNHRAASNRNEQGEGWNRGPR